MLFGPAGRDSLSSYFPRLLGIGLRRLEGLLPIDTLPLRFRLSNPSYTGFN